MNDTIMIQTPIPELRVSHQDSSATQKAVAHLFQALNQQGVRYCHWKSNLRLEKALKGQTDLDLLLDRKHSQVFRQILCEHNVKPILAPAGKRYPGLEDYLGFDPTSGRLFHLHVHYQLVLGEQFVKNYRLPLEAHFLDSAQLRRGVKIPAPELEIIVLSIRALLKYRDRDAIKDIMTVRTPGLPSDILNEIKWLSGLTSQERISQTLAEINDIVPADVVLEFLQTAASAPRDGYRLYCLRKRARRALRGYQRHNRLRAMLFYFQETWRRRSSLLRFSPSRNMTSANGGLTLALIGADGAGKSTMSHMLNQWLAWKLDVHGYYLGSKQPSRRSELLYILFRMTRRSHRTICRWRGEKDALSRLVAGLRDSLLYMHHLSIGRDRYRRFRSGKKQAMAGSIVIYDRYPLESISVGTEYRLLDGPQIPLTIDGEMGPITRPFARAERNLYRNMRLPDYLFVLDVSPDVSLQRKPDHERAVIEAKCRAVSKLTALAEQQAGWLEVAHFNADLPRDEVLNQLKEKIWEVL
jgi:hypothetical protein